ARAALHDASARVGMFASRIPFSQLSKNDSSPPSEKKQFYIIPDPVGSMVAERTPFPSTALRRSTGRT
ncbi:MAG: hypothetical protein II840_03470, partial [Kiritimatiellae bacterium]|nr:hypothetical protein [Kiritimatiellia bacterium]